MAQSAEYLNNSSAKSYWPDFFENVSNNASVLYEQLVVEVIANMSVDYNKWVFSIVGCTLVGLTGIFPLLLFPPGAQEKANSDNGRDSKPRSVINPKQLKRLLNFAVGSLLGDVFLHLLPEAWNSARGSDGGAHNTLMLIGYWVLLGIISFMICEKLVIYAEEEKDPSETETDKADPSNNNLDKSHNSAGSESTTQTSSKKHIAGYLNLLANCFDNFTHGLAVAGSFVSSSRIGLLTTAAILLHEIPHEIADFAILLRAGFRPWEAAKAQLSTASVGYCGALVTLWADSMQSMGNMTWWILPYTSGCFLNIALTNLLADLVKEGEDFKEAIKQLLCIILGIGVMAMVSVFHD